jgi:hypothetical protein
MLLFIEILTLLFFLGFVAHAVILRGAAGAAFFGAMLLLGFLRENFVVLRDLLYGFAPLRLMLGRAPLIASIIWGYSIYAAVVWAEAVSGERYGARRPSGRFLALVSIFMIALACFYEPFLALIGMARWQAGTRSVLGVPLITWIGYPSLAVLFLLLWDWAMERDSNAKRAAALLIPLPFLAVGHALGLHAIKSTLGF